VVEEGGCAADAGTEVSARAMAERRLCLSRSVFVVSFLPLGF
jgi:hypothetical protein